MAQVKWIKINTDIFDNRKIRQIEAMPSGDTIIVIWCKLLCLAGTTNDDGAVYITPDVPYTEQTLAVEFGRPLEIVQLALRTFEQFGMIEIVDSFLRVSNWEKYQNVDGMERIREQNRERKRLQRERERIAIEDMSRDSHVTGHAEVTQCHGTDIDKELDKDLDINKDIDTEKKSVKEVRHKYGQYSNVLLTDTDYEKLKSEFPSDYSERIENLSCYMASTGKAYKNHLATIRNWAKKDKEKQSKPVDNKFRNFEERPNNYAGLVSDYYS